ncbi:hypothetical protein [Acetanaerobacterium elongatum]|uniref:Uncharacterized protein n=1 Tax=Acetanaerobacterium elongatum TaxID=258515 RepID=A0A1H0C258_9FIRM|nr:hypothetical protein [Acetanaerobacterium elongatum]SDN51907.1 hypothetical protein SAMN05192585_12146 [Acetanaerobacterium elongatum]
MKVLIKLALIITAASALALVIYGLLLRFYPYTVKPYYTPAGLNEIKPNN